MLPIEIAKKAASVLDEKLAKDVKILKVEGLTSITDYFVVCSAGSVSQVKALYDYVDAALAKDKIYARMTEGQQAANWILMDYNDVIIHIFLEESRTFYAIEHLWSDAEIIEF